MQVSVARNIDASSVRSLQALPVLANTERQIEVTRRGPRQLILRDQRRSGAPQLDVRALSAGTLAQAREIGAETAGSRYVVSEEIVATVPSLTVRVFVQRYDRAGKVTGVAYIPIDGMEVVPRDFIAIDGRGVVRVLVPTASGVKIREYDFVRPPDGRRRLSDAELKRMGRAVREIKVKANIPGDIRTRAFPKGRPALQGQGAAAEHQPRAIVKNAHAYLTVDWVMARGIFPIQPSKTCVVRRRRSSGRGPTISLRHSR